MMHHAVIKHYANPKYTLKTLFTIHKYVNFMSFYKKNFYNIFYYSAIFIFLLVFKIPRVTLLRFLSWQWFERYYMFFVFNFLSKSPHCNNKKYKNKYDFKSYRYFVVFVVIIQKNVVKRVSRLW